MHSIRKWVEKFINNICNNSLWACILNINNVYFDTLVSQIYPSELQLNKANTFDTEAAFLDLHLSISNDIVSNKICDKRGDLILKLSISHF